MFCFFHVNDFFFSYAEKMEDHMQILGAWLAYLFED